MAKYTELFAEYLESGGELPAAVVTNKCNETIAAIKDEAYDKRAWVYNSCPYCFPRPS